MEAVFQAVQSYVHGMHFAICTTTITCTEPWRATWQLASWWDVNVWFGGLCRSVVFCGWTTLYAGTTRP